MTANEFPLWLQTTLLLAPSASAVVALVAFLFSVWNGWRITRREGSRRDWERLQQLAQVLHDGVGKGEWAQKLAVRELSQLRSKRAQAVLLATDALSRWDNPETAASPAMLAELREVIRKLSI